MYTVPRRHGDRSAHASTVLPDRSFLTPESSIPITGKKMRVFRAAQVLSKSVESGLRTVSLWPGGDGIPNCSDTADLVGTMDTMWDRVNGYVEKPDPEKLYPCPLTSVSPHLAYYPVAKDWMNSIQFKINSTKRVGLRVRMAGLIFSKVFPSCGVN